MEIKQDLKIARENFKYYTDKVNEYTELIKVTKNKDVLKLLKADISIFKSLVNEYNAKIIKLNLYAGEFQ